jgi:hypothetical protein
MKTTTSTSLLLLICILLFACDNNEIEFENDYEKSHNAWLRFKDSSNNSYKYVVFRSSFEGVAWETVITVSNGSVIQRDFQYTRTGDLLTHLPEEELKWTENENELGTHENTRAADLLTLDEVYDKTRDEWLIKREDAESYFEAKNNGLISSAGYYIIGCADDCSTGIYISDIVSL